MTELEEGKEIAKFGLGIEVFKYKDESTDWRFKYWNSGVSAEIILACVKAFLREQEDAYFEEYKDNLAKFTRYSGNNKDE